MNLSAIRKMEISSLLSLIPDDKLNQVEKYVNSILSKSKIISNNNRSLKGIWKNKGFDKIIDLDAEIKEVRKQLGDSILNRKI